MVDWQSERQARDERLAAGGKFAAGKMVAPNDTTALLEAVIRPKDRICLEGDNQKQADFLAACLPKPIRKCCTTCTSCSPVSCCPSTSTSSREASQRSSIFPILAPKAMQCRAP
jgi:Malonate decarboxylase, alpha subunit, transporter